MVFSRRNKPVPNKYEFKITELVRSRLLYVLKNILDQTNHLDWNELLHHVEQQVMINFGCLKRARNPAQGIPVIINHYFACDDEEVMDFFEFCFSSRWNCGGQTTIDAINRVLEDENIGYELTELRIEKSEGRAFPGSPLVEFSHPIPPIAIKKDEKLLHAETVRPCLHALTNPKFKTASDELLKAFEEYRRADYGDAITDAGAAYETVMKTICSLKKWAYDPQKDTAVKLVDILRDRNLFPPFYTSILTGTATIRNKVGDAHGKGPQPEFQATKELADHMLYSVCANINLLLSLAKV